MNDAVSNTTIRQTALVSFLALTMIGQLQSAQAACGHKRALSHRRSPVSRSLGRCRFRQCSSRERSVNAKCNEQPISTAGGKVNGVGSSAQSTWTTLFDGKKLGPWQPAVFGGEGEVRVEEGQIALDFGEMLTGIAWTEDFPKSDYEIRLEAKRIDGIDFFCALTFPVQDSHCTLVVGGWAGAVVGLSNIDDRDASENDTTRYMVFDDNRWYRIRVRVTRGRIQAWIDDRRVVDQSIQGRRVTIRPEVDLCTPLGIAAWQTRAALRNIAYRQLTASD